MARTINILPLGPAGHGKSALCNLLSGTTSFDESDTVAGGQNKTVDRKGPFEFPYDDAEPARLMLFDTPGTGDPELPLEAVADELKKVLDGKPLDAIVIVIKATADRTDIPQLLSMAMTKNFIDELKPAHIYICFTHSDQNDRDAEWVKQKVAELVKNFDGITVQENHIIKSYHNNRDRLKPFVRTLVQDLGPPAKLVADPKARVPEMIRDLPKLFPGLKDALEQAKFYKDKSQEYENCWNLKCASHFPDNCTIGARRECTMKDCCNDGTDKHFVYCPHHFPGRAGLLDKGGHCAS